MWPVTSGAHCSSGAVLQAQLPFTISPTVAPTSGTMVRPQAPRPSVTTSAKCCDCLGTLIVMHLPEHYPEASRVSPDNDTVSQNCLGLRSAAPLAVGVTAGSRGGCFRGSWKHRRKGPAFFLTGQVFSTWSHSYSLLSASDMPSTRLTRATATFTGRHLGTAAIPTL